MRHLTKYLVLFFILWCGVANATPPSRTYTYSTGDTIDPAKNTTNEQNIYTYLQGGVDTIADGSIVNADINASAGIAASKLDATVVETDTTQTITGSKTLSGTSNFTGTLQIGSVAVTSSAAELNKLDGTPAGLTSTELGYVDGVTSAIQTQFTGKEPTITGGTSAQFWRGDKTWVSPPASNVIYCFTGSDEDTATTNSHGLYFGTTLNTNFGATAANFYYLGAESATYQTVRVSKWTKVAGISTVTIQAKLGTESATTVTLNVDIGGAAATVSRETVAGGDFTWVTSANIDVSGLTNGTVYDITIQLKTSTGVSGYCSALILIGS